MDSGFKERIKELLVCAICYDSLKKPKTLNCGHMFCCICLESHAIQSEWFVKCPTCRQEQNDIKRLSSIAQLDAPLYIKQALEVLHSYRDDDNDEVDNDSNTMKESDQSNGICDLLEHCYICDEDGHWLSNCPQNDNDEKEFENEKLKPEDDAELHVELPEEGLQCCDAGLKKDDFCSEKSRDVEPYDKDFILTQEFTFDKICKKFHRRIKKQKKKLTGGDEGANTDIKGGDSKKSLATVVGEKYLKYQTKQERTKYDSTTSRLGRTYLKDSSASSPGRASKSSSNSPVKKQSLKPSTTTSSSTGSRYRPRYMPGTLNKSQSTMVGYGLPLTGQFGQRQGRRKQRQQTSSEHDSSTCSATGDGSSEFKGAFGKDPFAVGCGGAKRKVFVPLKF